MDDQIVLVHLRRPQDDEDARNDPYWEFGSFGITGCHKDNLLHPDGVDNLQGVRLGFAQGGPEGFKLIFLTPPISILKHKRCSETKWQPPSMPLKYSGALLLVANNGKMIAGMREVLVGVDRSTDEAKFSSRFRSRKSPLNKDFPDLAKQIAVQFDSLYARAKKEGKLAKTYEEALPWTIPTPNRDRESTYQQKLDKAEGIVAGDLFRNRPSKRSC